MASKRVTIDLFYDVISPYAWIAFEQLHRYAKVWPITLRLRPYFLGGVMKGSGNKPPIFVPAKGMYMLTDIERNNKYWGLQLVPPSNFAKIITTKTTLQAQRMLAAVSELEPEKLEQTSREFWTRLWHRGDSIFEQEDFEQVAKTVGLKRLDEIFEAMKSEKVKKIVSDNVQEAMDAGAFGAPWITVTLLDGRQESFFGSDRLPIIADLINQPYLGPLKEHAAKL